MKTIITLFALILAININLFSQDTFSITAVDAVSGYVGSAGASCIAGSIILSDVHPNRGVIHTQASYISGNQVYARNLMNMGLSPQQIIDSVVAHDVQNNPTVRQYGITDFVGMTVRRAGYTGVNCTNYKNHVLGTTLCAGHILLYTDSDQMFAVCKYTGNTADKFNGCITGLRSPSRYKMPGDNKSSISIY